MKKTTMTLFTLCLFLLTTVLSAQDARSIMEKNDAIPDGDTFSREMVLLIIKSGKNEKKEFTTVSKEYGRNRRSRMRFTFPTKMEFLSWDEPGQDNQQWIKLTSGKVRKIASSEKDKPWMNSLLGEETVDGKACHKIESVKVNGQKVYSRRIVYIGRDDYLMYRVDYYEKGQHTKTLSFSNYETIQGIPTPKKLTMERTDGKGKSVLYTKSVTYNVSVDDKDLVRESL